MKNGQFHFVSFFAIVLASIFAFSGCSNKLSRETTIQVNYTSESDIQVDDSTQDMSETSEIIESSHGPISSQLVFDKAFDLYGELSISEGSVVDSEGNAVCLSGLSTVPINSEFEFFNEAISETLAFDWGCRIVCLNVEVNGDFGYINNSELVLSNICDAIDFCLQNGTYVIVEWSLNSSSNPMDCIDSATDFFTRISTLYSDSSMILYSICDNYGGPLSEADTTSVSWSNTVSSYASSLVDVIRIQDDNAIIICGLSEEDINSSNITYGSLIDSNFAFSYGFTCEKDGQEFRDSISNMQSNGVPLICTGWTLTDSSMSGLIYTEEGNSWIDFMLEHNISWCYDSICGTSTFSANALLYESSILTYDEKVYGHWPDEFISSAGLFVRASLLENS